MLEKRVTRDDDQEKINKARALIEELTELNDHIEGTIWIAAFWSILAFSYQGSGATFNQFKIDARRVVEYYKPMFDEEPDANNQENSR